MCPMQAKFIPGHFSHATKDFFLSIGGVNHHQKSFILCQPCEKELVVAFQLLYRFIHIHMQKVSLRACHMMVMRLNGAFRGLHTHTPAIWPAHAITASLMISGVVHGS